MNLALSPLAERLITERVKGGYYASPEDVVQAALLVLRQQEDADDFAPGELEALIEEAEASGHLIDGDEFLTEWRALRQSAKVRAKP